VNQQNSIVYVLVKIQPGKEREFANEILAKGLILDPKVEKMNFVHGSFDFLVMLHGPIQDIDRRILEMRKFPFVRSTQTLIAFEMFTWEDLSKEVKK
jgi:hypothetical protein